MCVLRIPAADFAHTHADMIRINYRLVITTTTTTYYYYHHHRYRFMRVVLLNYNTRTSIIIASCKYIIPTTYTEYNNIYNV